MYLMAIDRLDEADFCHYEISNFARPGQRSRHNEVYWSGEGYFAAGPGAARYVDGVRETNHRSTSTYLKRMLRGESPVDEREQLDEQQRARELLIFGLRRLEGVGRQDFQERTGLSLDLLAGTQISQFVKLGLLSDDGEQVRLTREGLLISDSLWPELL
jgi:oxygen-independent coproporphyrinogen-3 oxidase